MKTLHALRALTSQREASEYTNARCEIPYRVNGVQWIIYLLDFYFTLFFILDNQPYFKAIARKREHRINNKCK